MYILTISAYLFKFIHMYLMIFIWGEICEFQASLIICVILIKFLTFLSLGFCMSN